MLSKQKGFSVLHVLLILVIVSIITGTGWYVLKSGKDVEKSFQSSTTSSDVNTAKKPERDEAKSESKVAWQTYENTDAKLTFQYPETWKHDIERNDFYENGTPFGIGGTLISPSGKKLTWSYLVVGGSGGGCTPDDNDIPFAAGNKCSSKQILSVEKTREVKAPQSTSFRNLFMDALIITRTKYMDTAGRLSYQICLDAYYTSKTATHEDETPKIGTQMEFVMPCQWWKTGFGAKFEVENEAEFKSDEANVAERIMKSFDSI